MILTKKDLDTGEEAENMVKRDTLEAIATSQKLRDVADCSAKDDDIESVKEAMKTVAGRACEFKLR